MFDWEEHLFIGLRKLYRQAFVRPEERRREEVRVTLRERRRTLLLLAEALAGRPLGILETSEPCFCGGDRIFLPVECSVALTRAANVGLLELRAIIAALALREGWHRHGIPLPTLLQRCAEEFPGLAGKLQTVRAGCTPDADFWELLGQLPEPLPPTVTSEVLAPASPPLTTGESITAELEGAGRPDVKVVPSREDFGDGEESPQHAFEKVETAEEYDTQSVRADQDGDLEEHAEALRDLRMTKVIRSPERPRSIYRTDLILDGFSLEVDAGAKPVGIPYPEWDYRRGRYRPDWCFVQETSGTVGRPGWATEVGIRHRALIRRLKRQFATLLSERLRLRCQMNGAEFDLDAVVASELERRTGHTPSEAVYLDTRRDLHDVAALVLIDGSYSTDAWIANRRVLDVITETVFCVGEVLEDYVGKFALASFASQTRQACRFELLKGFPEPWVSTRDRLGSLSAAGYTRIGPALRHAQELLARETASRKLIILITDGRPCDYDRYEGAYGIQDVKKAIETGQQQGLQTHAFAVEQQAAEYFPQMFTPRRYDIVPSPERLARTLCRLFGRLLAGG